ncbi:MAG: molybdopterin cofactor-binding domain-containing protein [Cyclobacteriaceae bacterium]
MTTFNTSIGRRTFLKTSALTGGGLMISFNWLVSCKPGTNEVQEMPDAWYKINGYLKIGENGLVTIMSPNPEGGQNIKTAMPMIVAEELDVDWSKVLVEQAPLDTKHFTRQFIGGSQAIRLGWQSLRMAGATARHVLKAAAAKSWNVDVSEITTSAGKLIHSPSGKKADYGAFASAATEIPIPDEVELKDPSAFDIIGTSRKNVDGQKIVTGQPLFGIDYRKPGMLIAMITHPPAFGLKIKSIDDAEAKGMPGIRDVFTVKVFNEGYEKQFFDTCNFEEVAVVVGESTWQVMKAKKALKLEYEPIESTTRTRDRFGRKYEEYTPAGLENSEAHLAKMKELSARPAEVRRKDGDPEAAFKKADKVIERSYSAPFLAHNCMEPMNFFADVTEESAVLAGPLQKPELTEQALSARLGIPVEKIDIQMTRLGGGYGRRSYAHWLIEAALISQRMQAPVKLIYSREDDMTSGIYRPACYATYRAALDKENNLTGFHVNAGGIPESPLYANRFPAGAVDHYLAEDWAIPSNITTGSFRAPRSNFMACAEQSFLDEVAEIAGKDPIAFRLALLEKAENDPVGENNDYDPKRYAEVLKLVREKSEWKGAEDKRGVAAYFCHNSYAAHVLDLEMKAGVPVINKVWSSIDCGVVVNPDAATNLVEGAIVDGIGNALFGQQTIRDGVPAKQNFDSYRMIRMKEAPKAIEVHFVQNGIDPTGLGEPAYPPVFAALANALYRTTGKRYYDQPFLG